jgi:hypothetical protein
LEWHCHPSCTSTCRRVPIAGCEGCLGQHPHTHTPAPTHNKRHQNALVPSRRLLSVINVCCGPGTPGCTPPAQQRRFRWKAGEENPKSKKRKKDKYLSRARSVPGRAMCEGVSAASGQQRGAVTYGCVWLLLLKKIQGRASAIFGGFGRPSSSLAQKYS